MGKDSFDFREEIKIDPDMLDVEWLNQPQLFLKYAEELERQKIELAHVVRNKDIVMADLGLSVRATPVEYIGKGVKITEKVIESVIITHPEYREAEGEVRTVQESVEMLKVALRAFEQRKDALSHLVKLHGQKYFAAPESDETLGSRNDLQKEKDDRVKEKIKRRTRRKRDE